MKRIVLLLLSSIFFFAACDQNGKVPQSQIKFLTRLKRTQDTVDLFSRQEAIKMRVITNMSKYVRDTALAFTGWGFIVENTGDESVDLKCPAKGDSTIYGVKFSMLAPEDAALKDQIAKLKAGDVIKADGELAMKTDDGKISMVSYFTSDSAKVIKFVPKTIK